MRGTPEPAPRGIAFGRHRPRIHPSAFVTEGAHVVGRVTVGRDASIWFGAVVRGDFEPIRIGEESLIEDNVVVHGRVVVGRRCVIGHGAILHGCSIGDGAVVGANAVVFDGARIGPGALVTAGSVVYPRTRVPARMLFRNSAGGNHPSLEPVGARAGRWEATAYRRLVAVYRGGPEAEPWMPRRTGPTRGAGRPAPGLRHRDLQGDPTGPERGTRGRRRS